MKVIYLIVILSSFVFNLKITKVIHCVFNQKKTVEIFNICNSENDSIVIYDINKFIKPKEFIGFTVNDTNCNKLFLIRQNTPYEINVNWIHPFARSNEIVLYNLDNNLLSIDLFFLKPLTNQSLHVRYNKVFKKTKVINYGVF